VLFFFQKKKQKALFRFAEDPNLPKSKLRRANAFGSFLEKSSINRANNVLLFPEKEAKSVVPLRGRPL
jgi:hypothetical protein